MEASVAPPRLMSSMSGRSERRRSGRVTGIQSPDRSARRKEPRVTSPRRAEYSMSISIKAGTEFQIVTACSAMHRAQCSGSFTPSASGMTIVPPAASVPKMSHTERSKLREERARTRSAGPTRKRSFTSSTVFTAPR